LVDFTITWELNQLYYVGHWLAVPSPVNQTLLWDLNLSALSAQVTTLTGQNMRMTRVQPFPQQAATAYSALFEAGSGSWGWYYEGLPNFSNKTQSLSGVTLTGLGYDLISGWSDVGEAKSTPPNSSGISTGIRCKRALPRVGFRHGYRSRVRGPHRSIVRIHQRHHRTIRHRLRTHQSLRP
jgi:hypothetical protein